MATIGASFKSKVITLPSEQDEIKLNIWDTAGQDKFRSITKSYFQNADAAIIVYDVTFKDSFEAMKNWIKDLKEIINIDDLVLAVVGNKCDMPDK